MSTFSRVARFYLGSLVTAVLAIALSVMPRSTLAAGAAGAPASPAPALDPAVIARVDASVEGVVAAAHVPSIAVAVAANGATAYSHAYGYANLEQKTPATTETHYEIGSITKQFTATAILQLEEAGKLSLDDTLAKWIPEYRRGAKITIRQLLQQTTGIANYTSVDGFVKIAETRPPSFAAMLALIRSKPLAFKPGSRFEYSNTNYILLGEIVERASGTSWEHYVRKNIFAPAGMTHSGFIDDEARLEPMAVGYTADKSGVKIAPALRSGWAWSAGAIVSTVDDMLSWDAALFGDKLIKPADLAAMIAPGKHAFDKTSSYGFGWVIDTADGTKRIWHNGGTFGFTAANLLFPQEHLAVVVLQNADSMATPESTAMRVFEAFVPSAELAAGTAAAGEDSVITVRVRDWLNRFETGNIDRRQLDAKMNKLLTPQFVSDAKTQLAPLGAPEKLIFLQKSVINNATVYTYRAVFPAVTFNVHIALDPAGKIAGFSLTP